MKAHNGVKLYQRGGRISGVWFEGKKYRLNRLGYTPKKLAVLDRHFAKHKELKEIRHDPLVQNPEIDKGGK
ncbi:MAG: hypothetical protein IH946_06065 [Bacteroidetes bacterium]|nr:hypothetical protein [Bacteroidota bacterium]